LLHAFFEFLLVIEKLLVPRPSAHLYATALPGGHEGIHDVLLRLAPKPLLHNGDSQGQPSGEGFGQVFRLGASPPLVCLADLLGVRGA
jgi:hypothetical protein